jgi:hypothetical protein
MLDFPVPVVKKPEEAPMKNVNTSLVVFSALLALGTGLAQAAPD